MMPVWERKETQSNRRSFATFDLKCDDTLRDEDVISAGIDAALTVDSFPAVVSLLERHSTSETPHDSSMVSN